MSVQSSDFYNKLSRLESARQTGITNLGIKGITVASGTSIPTIMARILTIPTTSITTIQQNLSTNGDAIIVAAELPGVTLTLKDASDNVLATQSTDATYGGAVTFALNSSAQATYTIVATDSGNNELWTNTITVNGIGVYNCKSGKAFANYTAAEVNTAAKNHYAQYMWSVGDSRNITTIGSSKKWVIAGFEHDTKASGGGKAGITMIMQSYTGSTYKHYNSNVNNIGWEGSLIRQNGLKVGDIYYTRETGLTSSSEGTYYAFDSATEEWVAKELPTDWDSTEVYYSQHIAAADGAFITGLSDWASYMVPVIKKTADAGSGYKKIIHSTDNVFLLSDGEIFGNSDRYSTYSKYALEGEQYEYFKKFTDIKIRLGSTYWLRSPYSGSATSFCCVDSYGNVSGSGASNTTYARLAFCL